MKRLLVSLILAVLALLLLPAPVGNSQLTVHRSLHSLNVLSPSMNVGKMCTSYAIGPHALLTAHHCVDFPDPLMIVDNHPMVATQILDDGFDHAIIYLPDAKFPTYIRMWQISPSQGTHVYTYGEPASYGMVNQYREGYVTGRHQDDVGRALTILVMAGVPGDSGSLIFDRNGFVVGVLSLAKPPFIGVYPLRFTAKQLKDASRF